MKEADFDPMFYREKLENLQDEIREANKELASCKEQCKESSYVKKTAEDTQPSALDILRREQAARKLVFL